jgi:DNA repair exonuclease SbcCD ATPase subunit
MFGTNNQFQEQKTYVPDPEIYAHYKSTHPDATEAQILYHCEQIEKENTAWDDRQSRVRKQIEDRKLNVVEARQAEAEAKQRRADELKAQQERQAKELADQKQKQEEAKKQGLGPAITNWTDEQIAAERARNADPSRKTSCPACGCQVALVDGKLPEVHIAWTTDSQQFKVKRECHPYAEPWRA